MHLAYFGKRILSSRPTWTVDRDPISKQKTLVYVYHAVYLLKSNPKGAKKKGRKEGGKKERKNNPSIMIKQLSNLGSTWAK